MKSFSRLCLVFALMAAVPAGADSLFRISPTHTVDCDRYSPAVAYNSIHDEYLVVWHNLWPGDTRDIYGQRIKSNGDLIGPWFCISCGSNDRFAPSVAYDSTQNGYLVVWTYDAEGDGSRYDIMGKLIPFNGPGTASELFIFSSPAQDPYPGYSGWFPVVVNDPGRNRYLAAWNRTSLGPTVILKGLNFEFVYPNGTTGGLDGPEAPSAAHQVDVAYHAGEDEYLFVWRESYVADTAHIWGIRLDGGTGDPVGGLGSEFRISDGTSTNERLYPSVATDSQQFYTVVWQQQITGDFDVVGVYLPSSDPTSTAGAEDLVADGALNETSPHVSAEGPVGRFAIAFQEDTGTGNQAVTTTSILLSQPGGVQVLTYPHVPVHFFAFSDAEAPVTVSSGKETLVIFEQEDSVPTAEREIWGWTLTIFRDGFDSSGTSFWSATSP